VFKKLLISLLLLGALSVQGAHLVGGEMSYECIGNGSYLVRVTIFRDCNSNGAALSDSIPVTAFSGNGDFYTLKSLSRGPIQMIQIPVDPCMQVPSVCTEYAEYSGVFQLPATVGGYTLSHQRCCRNSTISNVNNPGVWGNTFTTRIPSMDNSCNSSPRFMAQPPLLLCAGTDVTVDYSATEADGDSLYYELCSALHGASQNNPGPQVADAPPYNSVPYAQGFSSQNPIPANPAFQIDPNTGLLTGTPNQIGQYLFAVCVSEYRNGQMLSKVSRDFQFNVTACNPTARAQVIPQVQLPNTLCNGLTVAFQQNSIGALDYLWLFGDPANPSASSTQANPTFTYSDTGSYTVTLVINQGTVCSDTAERTFKINYPLEAEIATSGEFCTESQNITAEAVGQFGPNARFRWEIGGQTLSGRTIVLPQLNASGAHTLKLYVDDFGCSVILTEQVMLYQRPVLNDQVNAAMGCSPLRVVFQDQSSGSGLQHFWNFGDGNTSMASNPVHVYQTGGTFTVTHSIWSNLGCPDSITEVYTNIVEVIQSPDADVTVDQKRKSFYDRSFRLEFAASADVVYSETRMGDGSVYYDETALVHQYADTGTYEVVHIALNALGCGDTIVETLRVDPEVVLFVPTAFTPNGDGVNDRLFAAAMGFRTFEFVVFDRWGKVVFQTADPESGWDGSFQNAGSEAPAGMYTYVVNFTDDRGHHQQRNGQFHLLR